MSDKGGGHWITVSYGNGGYHHIHVDGPSGDGAKVAIGKHQPKHLAVTARMTPEKLSADHDRMKAHGAKHGSDWSVSSRPPENPKEAKAVLSQAEKGGFLVRKESVISRREVKDGAETEHHVGSGDWQAKTRPHKKEDKWVSETHQGVSRKSFPTEAEALAHSRNHVEAVARKQNTSEYAKPRNLDDYFESERQQADRWPNTTMGVGKQFGTTYHVIRPE